MRVAISAPESLDAAQPLLIAQQDLRDQQRADVEIEDDQSLEAVDEDVDAEEYIRHGAPVTVGHAKALFSSAVWHVQGFVPILKWLPAYDVRECLFTDMVGGMTIGMVCLAQTLAHAAIATTLPIQGPYCAFVPALVYAIFGTSPHASVSSGAIAAILIADQLRPWTNIEGETTQQMLEDRTHMASLLALVSGLALLFMGLCKLAFAMRFLSQPVLSGFITGGSLVIVTQQLKNLLGFKDFPHTSNEVSLVFLLVKKLPEADPLSLILGVFLMAVLEGLNRLKAWSKAELKRKSGGWKWAMWTKRLAEMKEIVATLLGFSFGYLTATADGPIVACVGEIQPGLPPFHAPWDYDATSVITKHDHTISSFIIGGVLVAFSSFLTTYATAKKMALEHDYTIDPSQEMIALGCAGIAGSFFGAFTPSGSLSRTGLAADCGVKTQLGGAFSVVVIGLGLQFLTPMLRYLPKATLAAIICISTKNLVELGELARLWKKSSLSATLPGSDVGSNHKRGQGGLQRDVFVWLTAFVITCIKGVVWGIGCAVLASVGMMIVDASSPQGVVLGVLDKKRFRSLETGAKPLPGILVFEFRGPLSFASAEWFQDQIEACRMENEQRSGTPVKIVVLSFSSVHLLDSTALAMLRDLLKEWKRRGLVCIVSGAKGQVRYSIEDEFVHEKKEKDRLLDQTSFMIDIKDAVNIAKARIRQHLASLSLEEEQRIICQPSVGDILDEKQRKLDRSNSAMPSLGRPLRQVSDE